MLVALELGVLERLAGPIRPEVVEEVLETLEVILEVQVARMVAALVLVNMQEDMVLVEEVLVRSILLLLCRRLLVHILTVQHQQLGHWLCLIILRPTQHPASINYMV